MSYYWTTKDILPDGAQTVSDTPLHTPDNPVRFITAASLFDGHDAAINIMRRLLQSQGAEVIHLGHDRSVADVVAAAMHEDVQGIAISSYQGGHVEYFSYLIERLKEMGCSQVRVFGGGGGVIVAEEIALLAERGVRIFSPQDGQRLGLPGMVNTLIRECDVDLSVSGIDIEGVLSGSARALARTITVLQSGKPSAAVRDVIAHGAARGVPVLGITGTGGSGKSSLTDELVRRFRRDSEDKLRIAIIAVDPSRRRGGGALLGDRIRMNALSAAHPDRIFFRSLATRTPGRQLPDGIDDILAACAAAGFDLIMLETPGIGQGDAEILPHVTTSLYVMTPEFGAPSQLEKIDMLDFADFVAVNKFERRGAEDARRDVARQLVRNRGAFGRPWEEMPVYGTSAARFDDDGVTALYRAIKGDLVSKGLPDFGRPSLDTGVRQSGSIRSLLPRGTEGYLADIAATVRRYHDVTAVQSDLARRIQHLRSAGAEFLAQSDVDSAARAGEIADDLQARLDPRSQALLDGWPSRAAAYQEGEIRYLVRGEEVCAELRRMTLSGSSIPKIALPRYSDAGDMLRFLRNENLPGDFPFTAGVFPVKRTGEAPARMFAGEGDAHRTNRRFHLLSAEQPATRLSTAFDSVTLYGRDPAPQPDVYGKVGTSGVSVATLDDMKELYRGFDLCSPSTSVSMTINGPAPTILAMFLNTAIDQRIDAFRTSTGHDPDATEFAHLRSEALRSVRGTVQADILKEDQGQNTCIFSTEFSLRCMADVQEWFIANEVRNFYSVSISGYHIAEAGANPISQLAFTLANGFTYVEAYLARGLAVDDFTPHFSFFFSNGMDAEYTVLGRVARRIWSITMRDRYGAGERAQKLKYHVQTSGRSLHAQEIDFNDIRTTLQALCAVYDNANSLHTNAYDEAITTPTEQSVRRALAIQMIIDQEWGLSMNENPLQGSFIVEELTDLVEEAVLAEFERISDRGGVLGAMETGYQRGRIQDESMLYEHRKHDGSLPIIGVNTFVGQGSGASHGAVELARGTEDERQSQLTRLRAFHDRHREEAPVDLERLQRATTADENIFEVLMSAVRTCSLGQITEAFFEVGGQYRRNV